MWNQLVEAIQKLLGRIPAPTQDEDPRIAWQVQWEEARAQRRAAREAQRHQRRAADRRHFGEETWGVAKTQRGATADAAKLARFGLPLLRNEAELAAWLGISLTRLRWFSYDRPADRVSHYVYRHVPKRSGG
nr:hypothetical protein [Chloroflexaceae bacterium]